MVTSTTGHQTEHLIAVGRLHERCLRGAVRDAKLLILVPLKCRIDLEPELIEIQQQEMSFKAPFFGATKD